MKATLTRGRAGSLGSDETLEEGDFTMDDSSSTSTAGPFPGTSHCTDRLTRSWNLDITNVCKSEGTSPASSTVTRNVAERPGQPKLASPESKIGTSMPSLRHSQTISNTSTCISPVGSSSIQREWGRSFRLFNTSRCFGSTCGLLVRESFHHMHRANLISTLYGKTCLDNDRSPHASPHVRPNGTSSCGSPCAPYYGHNPSLEMLRGSSIVSFYTNATNSPALTCQDMASSVSPHTPLRYMSIPTILVLAKYATGGGQLLESSLSRFQKELPTLLSTLRTFLALNGETIIVSDSDHRVEIKRGGFIGVGGFAILYIGVNTVKGELVAIKEIKMDDVDDVRALKAVEKEFALLKSLRHPNIVNYHFFEHSRSQRVCRIVMELLAGDSMLQLLQRYGPLKETVLRKLARDLLSAIDFIHKNGIFHRDIKPANILISHHGKVKLCDFGCGKRVFEISRPTSCIIGTPVYMSPEFIKGEADHKADIWSFACSLFEMGTGLLPWHHSGVKDNLPLMFYITTTSETPLAFFSRGNGCDFSPEFLNFLELCFTRNPEKRPDAEELMGHPWLNNSVSSSTDLTTVMLSDRLSLPTSAAAAHGIDSAISQSRTLNAFGTKTPKHRSSVFFDRTFNTDNFSNSDRDVEIKSAVSTQTGAPFEDEILCQHELEEVAAIITVERCTKLMVSPELRIRTHDRGLPELSGATRENSSILPRNISVTPSSPSQRGVIGASLDFPSSVFSPEHSIVHESFHFNHTQLGPSAGNFFLPNDIPEFAYQQYLRINDSGNLEFATVTEYDNDVQMENSVLLQRPTSGDISPFSISHNSRFIHPLRSSSLSWRSTTPTTGERQPASPKHTGSIITVAPRGESPFLHTSNLHTHTCPHISSLPLLLRSNGFGPHVSPPPPGAHLNNLNGDELSQLHSPLSIASHRKAPLSALHEKVKPHADGKLHMSFCVNTAHGDEMNVELKVDVNNVHCKMVDNQPNFFIAFSDSIKEQITAKLREAAQSSEELPLPGSSRASTPYRAASRSMQSS
ncbi:unnamed protein product [Phytomonas sp. EM1]|nr:unnamed protein product [Phytomonas sp. EM1]|eukprot:CCW62681.1 unnamed protein product [Phytomonas sp. isolate EM1]